MAGMTSDQIDRLVIAVYAHGSLDPACRRTVGPYRAVLVVLLYRRHNLSQALAGPMRPPTTQHHHQHVDHHRPHRLPGQPS